MSNAPSGGAPPSCTHLCVRVCVCGVCAREVCVALAFESKRSRTETSRLSHWTGIDWRRRSLSRPKPTRLDSRLRFEGEGHTHLHRPHHTHTPAHSICTTTDRSGKGSDTRHEDGGRCACCCCCAAVGHRRRRWRLRTGPAPPIRISASTARDRNARSLRCVLTLFVRAVCGVCAVCVLHRAVLAWSSCSWPSRRGAVAGLAPHL